MAATPRQQRPQACQRLGQRRGRRRGYSASVAFAAGRGGGGALLRRAAGQIAQAAQIEIDAIDFLDDEREAFVVFAAGLALFFGQNLRVHLDAAEGIAEFVDDRRRYLASESEAFRPGETPVGFG